MLHILSQKQNNLISFFFPHNQNIKLKNTRSSNRIKKIKNKNCLRRAPPLAITPPPSTNPLNYWPLYLSSCQCQFWCLSHCVIAHPLFLPTPSICSLTLSQLQRILMVAGSMEHSLIIVHWLFMGGWSFISVC